MMKVKDLQDILKTLPPDADVVVVLRNILTEYTFQPVHVETGDKSEIKIVIV